jgi:DNA-binding GntR family transcriptional regulator
LRDLEEGFEKATSADEMARFNRLFHECIFASSRNRYLDSALQELQDAIALLGRTTFTVEARPVAAFREHRDLIEAIGAQDADKADALARAHIRESLRARLRIMQQG